MKFGQMPGHPTVVQGTLRGGSESLRDMNLSFTVHEVGDVTDDDADGSCPNVGEIFNPLAEYVWWDRMVNPFADPSRGAIRPTTVDFDDDGNFVFTQTDFLQNLGGKNSLIGRSIKASASDAMGVA